MAILTIDRSAPFDLQSLGIGTRFNKEHLDVAAATLETVDTSKFKLEKLLKPKTTDPKRVNREIKESLERVSQAGLVLLDAKVLAALLASPEAIPSTWQKIADSDAYSDMMGSICFYGSVFETRQPEEREVLTLNFARGQWSLGYSPATFSPEELNSYTHSGQFSYGNIFAAVLAP